MRIPTRFSALTFFVSALALTAEAAAPATWPQFRGPNGAGIAPDDKAGPVEFSPQKALAWKAELPGGNSSPCLWEDRIFLTAFGGGKLETICLDRNTGKVRWRKTAAAEKIEKCHEIGSPASSTAVSDGKAVYVYFGSYGLIAYDFDGGVLWEKPLPIAKTFRNFGTGTSPVLAGDKIVVDMHLDGDSHLLAVNRADGKTAWTVPKPNFNFGWSTPVLWTEEGEETVGTLNGGRFTAYTLKDGVERWWVSGLPNQICATPVLSEGVLFLNGTGVLGNKENIIALPSFDEIIAKYDANKDGKIAMQELPEKMLLANRGASDGAGDMTVRQGIGMAARGNSAGLDRAGWDEAVKGLKGFLESDMMKTSALAVRTGGKQDATATHVLWTETKGVPEVPSPLLYRGRAYYIKNGGILTCRDPKTGKALFDERIGSPGGYYASPVAGGGRIYLASDRGIVTVLEAGDTLRVLSHNEFGERIMATPALLGGNLYVRSASHLYAF